MSRTGFMTAPRLRRHESIQRVRPGMKVFEVSSKAGEGMDDLVQFLAEGKKC